MTRYSDPFVCPDCGSRLPVQPLRCPQCALPLRGPLASSLFQTLQRADQLLLQLRASAAVEPGAVAAPPAPAIHSAETLVPRTPRARGLRGASVPTILLGLGALCLLVAAVTFLAVAWSWLGVGGRTTVLVALTVTAGALGTWLGARGQRLGGEALTLVALALLALDVVGADRAGWLGDLSAAGLVCWVGGAVAIAGAALLPAPARLATPQVATAMGLWVALVGATGVTERGQLVAAAGVVAYAVLARVGRALPVLPWAALVGGVTWWTALVVQGLDDATAHATLRALWAEGHGLGLLAASLALLLPLVVVPARNLLVQACVGAAATLATLTLALPGLDDGVDRAVIVSLSLLVLWTAAAAVAPTRLALAPRAPMALTALPLVVVSAELLARGASTVLSVGEAFTRGAGVRLDPAPTSAHPGLLVPAVLGLVVAALVVAPGARRVTGPAALALLGLAGIGTLALHPVPLWTVAAALGAVAAGLVGDALRRTGRLGTVEAAAGTAVATVAVAVALPSAALTTGAAALLVLVSAASSTARSPGARLVGRTVLPLAIAGLLWSGAEVAAVDQAYRAAPVLLVVGLMAVLRPRVEVETAAALAGLVAAVPAVAAATDQAGSLALHLTLAGALVSASALITPSRRPLGWLGGALLALATWVRLADLGVQAPEAYTLPSAAALLLVGLHRLHRDPRATTTLALTPGLALATTPSLLWVLTGDVVSVRAALLGAGCLVLVLAGTRLRWSAPLVVGAGVGLLLVLRELAPWAAATPQWVLIGFAGTLLTVVGVTWERRMLEVSHAAAYLGRLR